MNYTCTRCKSRFNDEQGLCYSCKCDDFLNGKCDSWGHSLVTEISDARLNELLKIEKKYNERNVKLVKG